MACGTPWTSRSCYVGQEVVSRIENRGHPTQRLVGLAVEECPESGAAVFAGDEHVGDVTRAGQSPMREAPIALANLSWERPEDALTIRIDGEPVSAQQVDLPFIDGSAQSARLRPTSSGGHASSIAARPLVALRIRSRRSLPSAVGTRTSKTTSAS